MSTELATPPVNVEAPAVPSNSDDAVAARFREAMNSDKGNQNSVHHQQAQEKKGDKVEEKTEQKESKGDEIPPEFLGETKAEDEYDTLVKEEPKGPVKHENYKKFQAAADKKVQALKQELEEIKAKVPKDDYVPEKVSKQLETLQKQLQEKEELIARKYVEETPAFQERFTQKKESIVNRLNKAAKDFELPERVVKGLLSATSIKDRSDILEEAGLGTVAVSSITAILDQYDSVESEKADFLSDWKGRSAELEEQAQRKSDSEKAKIKAYEERVFEDTAKALGEKYTMFKKYEGNKGWMEGLDSDMKEAKAIFDGEFTPEVISELALAGVRARRMGPIMDNMINQIRSLNQEIADLKAAGPSTPAGGAASKADPTANMSADERAAYTFNQLKGLASNGR